jgi:hypothetical protein
MSGIFGALGLADSDRVWLSTLGQGLVYEGINSVLSDYSQDLEKALACFVERKTTDHKVRYKLPGGGRLQRKGRASQAAASKAYGGWDVAFPLEEFEGQLAIDRVALGYMTVQDLDRHLDNLMIQDQNTVRFELLYALFHKTQRTFTDENWGDLTVECLANGDGVVYPPVMGSETEAIEDHYLGSTYLASAISDTNNPIKTIVADLEHHFGTRMGGSNICCFINQAQVAKISDLTGFDESPSRFVVPGDDTAVATGWPVDVPGTILGYCDGAWVSRWDWIPASYILALHLDAPRPVMMRVDPEYTGLGDGSLQLVAKDREHPFESSFYSHRFGLACANRLNGVVMDLSNADNDYDIPSAYA